VTVLPSSFSFLRERERERERERRPLSLSLSEKGEGGREDSHLQALYPLRKKGQELRKYLQKHLFYPKRINAIANTCEALILPHIEDKGLASNCTPSLPLPSEREGKRGRDYQSLRDTARRQLSH